MNRAATLIIAAIALLLVQALSMSDEPKPAKLKGKSKEMVDLIHLLENEPLRSDATDIRSKVFIWLVGEHKIGLTLCRGYFSEVKNDKIISIMMLQGTMSGAAFKLEYPDKKKDLVAVWSAAYRGALLAYANMKKQDSTYADAAMDSLQDMEAKGNLTEYVNKYLASCNETEKGA